jgi:hypothetical protein
MDAAKFALLLFVVTGTWAQAEVQRSAVSEHVPDPQDHPRATNEKAGSHPLSGTVVDTSGAVITGATVLVKNANDTEQTTTQSDGNGFFVIPGLPAGNYRLVVSHPAFETKEIAVTIGAETPPPLRISLAVLAVSTSVNVQGREDDLVGVADSATQGTVGAKELRLCARI